jgi:hypothetical protein
MPSSAGDEGGAVSPQAKKRRLNAVARAAAFRRRREQGSKTLNVCGWRSQKQTHYCS